MIKVIIQKESKDENLTDESSTIQAAQAAEVPKDLPLEPFVPRLEQSTWHPPKSSWEPKEIVQLVLVLGVLGLVLTSIIVQSSAIESLLVIIGAIAGYYFRATTKRRDN
ncbi:hypothetical protein [Rathayibacter sp. AY1C7]|uniref:hypothetical protein n=1 Tax=Rathayibacter sp. AY1C7 TaxID=2080540 RepID=UPI0011B0523E|nr:hypothetical protein [Rathayibacter sp. AY1C7]